MFHLAIAAMKPSRREKGSGLMLSGIKSISQAISFRICSSLVMAKDRGVGGGYLGYCGRFGVDLDWCKLRGCRERVNLVFQSNFSISQCGKQKLSVCQSLQSQVVALFIFLNHVAIRREGCFGFPCRFFNWVSFPFDIILVSSSSSLMFEDGFDFINFFSLKQFRGWFWEVISMSFIFDVWAQ